MLRGNSAEHESVEEPDTVGVFVAGLERAIRYPVPTVTSTLLSAILFFGIVALLDRGHIGHTTAFAAGTVLSIALSQSLIALIVMDPDNLPDIRRLSRSIAFSSISTGLSLCVVPVIAVHLLREYSWVQGLLLWMGVQAPYAYATIGPVFLFGAFPAALFAWPMRVRYDANFDASLHHIWQTVEGRDYSPIVMSVLVGAVGGGMVLSPVFALLAPALIVQLSASAFEKFEGDAF